MSRFELLGKVPRSFVLAISGGVDSVAALDFLSKNHEVVGLHINHNEGNSDETEEFVKSLASKYQIPLNVVRISEPKPKRYSREEWWSINRYKAFHALEDIPVITCHHLDDCVETWVYSSLNGKSAVIPYRNKNVIRPFLLNRKSVFIDWCLSRGLTWIEDESNQDLSHKRNYVRKVLMPSCLEVNPGLHTVVRKKVILNNQNR